MGDGATYTATSPGAWPHARESQILPRIDVAAGRRCGRDRIVRAPGVRVDPPRPQTAARSRARATPDLLHGPRRLPMDRFLSRTVPPASGRCWLLRVRA